MKEKLVNELIEYFINESNYTGVDIPNNYEEKRKLLRGLINIREPITLSEEILKKEDQLLQLELQEKEIVDVNTFKEKVSVYQGDITYLKTDAIVNACNEYLLGFFIPNHSCIDNQIHTYAGISLRLKCNEIMKGNTLDNGDVVLTKGYNLPCKYIIHTVGPKVNRTVTKKDKEDLRSCYINSLNLAKKNKIRSIVFPCISTGVYAYPKEEASSLAYTTVINYLKENDQYFDKIIFNVFTDQDKEIYERLFKNKRIN